MPFMEILLVIFAVTQLRGLLLAPVERWCGFFAFSRYCIEVRLFIEI
jgi:hypothetical protein